jgi:hypothetical protein
MTSTRTSTRSDGEWRYLECGGAAAERRHRFGCTEGAFSEGG